MRLLLAALIFCLTSGQAVAQQGLHAPWDRLLGTYVSRGEDGVNRFDYKAVTAPDRAALQTYLATLQTTQVSTLSRDAQMAFWINLYNALTVKVVLDAYPVGSIREIRNGLISIGPWKKERVRVEGRDMSLNDIEHDTLRAQWTDPRIHYAVNCASWSCPDLQNTAFTADNLDALLDQAARAYINHPRGAWFEGDGLHVSSIFKWYKADFGGTDQAVIAHLKQYAEADLRARLDQTDEIEGTDYDWTLNEPGKGKGDW